MNASIKINQELIRTLSSVLGISPEVIWESARISRSTWYNIMKNPADISIEQLLGISNGQRIPVRRFFYCGEREYVIGKKDDYVTEPYLECTYNADALREVVSTRSDATWQRAADAVGMTPVRLRDSLLAVTRTPVSRFLTVCRTFGIDPFTVLTDPNPERRKAGRRGEASAATEINTLRTDIAHLSATIAGLMEKYRDVAEKYDSLRSEYDGLLDAHKTLLRRFDECIDSGSVAMAAEP